MVALHHVILLTQAHKVKNEIFISIFAPQRRYVLFTLQDCVLYIFICKAQEGWSPCLIKKKDAFSCDKHNVPEKVYENWGMNHRWVHVNF